MAVLEAAGELLLGRGLSEVSMDAVAARAGVSKATIYRWWPTKESLVLDTLYYEWDLAPATPPDSGSLREDLLSYMLPWVTRARMRPFGRVIAELVAVIHADNEFCAQYQAHFVEPRRLPVREVFQRAIERGEVPPHDVELAIDLVFGPIYHRLLHVHAPLDDRYVEVVIDTVLLGLAASPEDAKSRMVNHG